MQLDSNLYGLLNNIMQGIFAQTIGKETLSFIKQQLNQVP